MPKAPSRSRFLITISFLIFLFISVAVGLYLMRQNQDIRQKAYNGDFQDSCVKAGCYNQVCISREEDRQLISSVCDYQPIYACYKNVECKIQPNGKCGFTPSSDLEKCLTSPQPPTCQKDNHGNPVCPSFTAPAPGFCQGGTITPGGTDQCGCQKPPTCQYTTEISIGNQRPTDQQLEFQRVSVNQDPPSRMITTTNDVPVKDQGNAQGFVFKAEKGQKLHLLAKETDSNKYGSYIRTAFYNSNGVKLTSADTRISDFIVPATGDYYLVVYTFKKVDAYFRLAIFEQNQLDFSVFIINNFNLELSINPYRRGNLDLAFAHPFTIAIQFPNDAVLNSDNTVSYFDKLEGSFNKTRPILFKFENGDDLKNYVLSGSGKNPENITLSQASGRRIWVKDSNGAQLPENNHYLLDLSAIYETSGVSGNYEQYAWSATLDKQDLYCDMDANACPTGYRCIKPPANCGVDSQSNPLTCAFRAYCQKADKPSADINYDGKVDIDDYTILKQELLKHLARYQADLNKDGWVDLDDYSILKQQLSIF